MKYFFQSAMLMLILTVLVFSQAPQQFSFDGDIEGNNPPFIVDEQIGQFVPFNNVVKRPGHYSRDDWQILIDSVWGPGLPTATKLTIFDKFWTNIDSAFACFHNHPLNWDSLKALYRPEIAAGVSRGRFSAIISKLSHLLKESHTVAYDVGVNNSPMNFGIPLFNINGLGNNGFGAGLTPLPDSTVLVYNVINNHPLNLQIGDRILGYDGIPWRILYKQILSYQLPIRGGWIGSSPDAYSHTMLRSVGRNWHLFDTIDIVKYSTGDTAHLPTSLMAGQNLSLYNTEQLDIPGVPKPNYPNQVCSYGIITNTNIGYIYCWVWSGNAQQEFFDAIQALMQTDAMIIDFRYNLGGNMHLSNPGLSLLFDTIVTTVSFGRRCSPNHQEMCAYGSSVPYNIVGAPPGYNKPIAVLTGPGAVSSGDQVALRLKYHKHSRIFGKTTSAAFNTPDIISLHNDFYFRNARSDAFELSDSNRYLTHEEFPVDENVWLTPGNVVLGKDDVVEAAKTWINSQLNGIVEDGTESPVKYILKQNYPNPFNPVTKISFAIPNADNVKLIIYDISGREVLTLINEKKQAGTYEVEWNALNYSSGVYFYKLEADGFMETKKMLLVK